MDKQQRLPFLPVEPSAEWRKEETECRKREERVFTLNADQLESPGGVCVRAQSLVTEDKPIWPS